MGRAGHFLLLLVSFYFLNNIPLILYFAFSLLRWHGSFTSSRALRLSRTFPFRRAQLSLISHYSLSFSFSFFSKLFSLSYLKIKNIPDLLRHLHRWMECFYSGPLSKNCNLVQYVDGKSPLHAKQTRRISVGERHAVYLSIIE